MHVDSLMAYLGRSFEHAAKVVCRKTAKKTKPGLIHAKGAPFLGFSWSPLSFKTGSSEPPTAGSLSESPIGPSAALVMRTGSPRVQGDGYAGLAHHACHHVDVVLVGQPIDVGLVVAMRIDTAPRRIESSTFAMPVSSPFALRTIARSPPTTPASAPSSGWIRISTHSPRKSRHPSMNGPVDGPTTHRFD